MQRVGSTAAPLAAGNLPLDLGSLFSAVDGEHLILGCLVGDEQRFLRGSPPPGSLPGRPAQAELQQATYSGPAMRSRGGPRLSPGCMAWLHHGLCQKKMQVQWRMHGCCLVYRGEGVYEAQGLFAGVGRQPKRGEASSLGMSAYVGRGLSSQGCRAEGRRGAGGKATARRGICASERGAGGLPRWPQCAAASSAAARPPPRPPLAALQPLPPAAAPPRAAAPLPAPPGHGRHRGRSLPAQSPAAWLPGLGRRQGCQLAAVACAPCRSPPLRAVVHGKQVGWVEGSRQRANPGAPGTRGSVGSLCKYTRAPPLLTTAAVELSCWNPSLNLQAVGCGASQSGRRSQVASLPCVPQTQHPRPSR